MWRSIRFCLSVYLSLSPRGIAHLRVRVLSLRSDAVASDAPARPMFSKAASCTRETASRARAVERGDILCRQPELRRMHEAGELLPTGGAGDRCRHTVALHQPG